MKTKIKNDKSINPGSYFNINIHGVNENFDFNKTHFQKLLENFVFECAVLGQNVTSIGFFEEKGD